MCYTVGSCWLSILNTAMCTCPCSFFFKQSRKSSSFLNMKYMILEHCLKFSSLLFILFFLQCHFRPCIIMSQMASMGLQFYSHWKHHMRVLPCNQQGLQDRDKMSLSHYFPDTWNMKDEICTHKKQCSLSFCSGFSKKIGQLEKCTSSICRLFTPKLYKLSCIFLSSLWVDKII